MWPAPAPSRRSGWSTPRKAFRAEELSGRLSASTWSPDSKRVYVVARDETGTRLVEVARSNLVVRLLQLAPLPGGLELASVTVSPDGTSLLAVADRPGRRVEEAEPVPGGQLYLGRFGPDGVTSWSRASLPPASAASSARSGSTR